MEAPVYDVIVIGAGPGGYVTAIRAAQLGLKCAIVEREHLGGICLNWGCIPTKALLRTAEVLHLASRAKSFGLAVDGLACDTAAVFQRSRTISSQLNAGVGYLLNKNKVDVIWGEASIAPAPPGSRPCSRSTPRRNRRADQAAIRPATSSSPPARARACCRGWRRTATASGPTSRP